MIRQRFPHPGFHSPSFSVYKNTNSVVETFFDRIRLSTAQIIKNSFPSLELFYKINRCSFLYDLKYEKKIQLGIETASEMKIC